MTLSDRDIDRMVNGGTSLTSEQHMRHHTSLVRHHVTQLTTHYYPAIRTSRHSHAGGHHKWTVYNISPTHHSPYFNIF